MADKKTIALRLPVARLAADTTLGHWTRICVLLTLALITAQFGLAGVSLFVAPELWDTHRMLGGVLALPLVALLMLTRRTSAGTRLATPARLLFVLYLLQVMLAAAADTPGWEWLRALHVGNAALVVMSAWHLAQRTMRWHASH